MTRSRDDHHKTGNRTFGLPNGRRPSHHNQHGISASPLMSCHITVEKNDPQNRRRGALGVRTESAAARKTRWQPWLFLVPAFLRRTHPGRRPLASPTAGGDAPSHSHATRTWEQSGVTLDPHAESGTAEDEWTETRPRPRVTGCVLDLGSWDAVATSGPDAAAVGGRAGRSGMAEGSVGSGPKRRLARSPACPATALTAVKTTRVSISATTAGGRDRESPADAKQVQPGALPRRTPSRRTPALPPEPGPPCPAPVAGPCLLRTLQRPSRRPAEPARRPPRHAPRQGPVTEAPGPLPAAVTPLSGRAPRTRDGVCRGQDGGSAVSGLRDVGRWPHPVTSPLLRMTRRLPTATPKKEEFGRKSVKRRRGARRGGSRSCGNGTLRQARKAHLCGA